MKREQIMQLVPQESKRSQRTFFFSLVFHIKQNISFQRKHNKMRIFSMRILLLEIISCDIKPITVYIFSFLNYKKQKYTELKQS